VAHCHEGRLDQEDWERQPAKPNLFARRRNRSTINYLIMVRVTVDNPVAGYGAAGER
jgi:hypothetical protein